VDVLGPLSSAVASVLSTPAGLQRERALQFLREFVTLQRLDVRGPMGPTNPASVIDSYRNNAEARDFIELLEEIERERLRKPPRAHEL